MPYFIVSIVLGFVFFFSLFLFVFLFHFLIWNVRNVRLNAFFHHLCNSISTSNKLLKYWQRKDASLPPPTELFCLKLDNTHVLHNRTENAPKLPMDPGSHLIHAFLGPPESICQLVELFFAQLMVVTNRHTQTQRPCYVCKCRPHLCIACMQSGLTITSE